MYLHAIAVEVKHLTSPLKDFPKAFNSKTDVALKTKNAKSSSPGCQGSTRRPALDVAQLGDNSKKGKKYCMYSKLAGVIDT